MRAFFILFFFTSLVATAQNNQQPIGAWREYLPYGSVIDVTASQKTIYAATPYSLFSVDVVTNEVERFSKVSGLSETGISTIKYDLPSNKLVVAYTNSNIDILLQGAIRNIPDLLRATILGDKSIYHIYTANNLCYLSTGFGVVVLDLQKYEIKDTWLIGDGGRNVKTAMFTQAADFYYAATEEGLKKAAISTTNPADFRAWQPITITASATACKGVVSVQNKIIAWQNDSLYIQDGTAWKPFFANGWPIISINTTENKVLICQRMNTGESKVTVLNDDGSLFRTLQQPPLISFPKNA
ncbi:MAG TPA: hypothetical protein VM888_07835, partial [Chitinophagaceae bacterium]|nr:hypothetical protein [Chitinophagaceae bacterium]